jgi:hypothetical protein
VNVKLNEAQNQGTHVFNYDKYCRGAKDYFSLAREIITIDSGVPAVEPPAYEKEETRPEAPASRIAHAIKEVERNTRETAVRAEDTESRLTRTMDTMIKEELPRMKGVTFTFDAPQAKEIYVAGEFNGWRVDDSSRMIQENGIWKKHVDLPAGSYRYRFVVDGTWVEDTRNPLRAVNPYGTMDSLIEINS